MDESLHGEFETTHWSLVSALDHGDESVRTTAFEELTRQYWPAVYAYLRRKGHDSHQARDLTQSFFADVIISRDLFRRADRERARLRTLVIAALRNYVSDQYRRRKARGGDLVIQADAFEIEESRIRKGETSVSSELAYDRRWAVLALEEALKRARIRFTANGREGHWQLFHAWVIQPAISGCEPPALSELAGQFGFSSAAHGSAAMQVVRKCIVAVLRQVIAETTLAPDDQEEELRHLLDVLKSPHH